MAEETFIDGLLPALIAVRLYHRHEVVGLEKVPKEGRVLIVVNHSLATYDIMLLETAIYQEIKRLPRPLIDRLFFKIPFLGEICTFFGAVEGNQKNAEELLNGDNIVTVAPGGMREALRPSSERYQIRWDRRLGFVKLAMRTQSPIILAACPRADDLYDVYPNRITSWIYKNYKIPVFLARGFGPTPLPRPVKLVHFLSEPLTPPQMPESDADVERVAKVFHGKLIERMHALIGEAIQFRP